MRAILVGIEQSGTPEILEISHFLVTATDFAFMSIQSMCTKEEYCGDIISESELLPNDRSMKSIEMESTETQAAARKRPKTTGLDEERMAACLFMKPIRVNAVNRLYLKEISGSQTL
ncbi:unnamed protein product [Albugo candida]|uniref:Uncharacterized protein n=1 Tax=Albugo candida TaxID=65357 RepID=A0A024GAP2_9STRA|nr:unnamed protein product [Albugo candida]|eukprot:CCI43901.1 unnamed protein product [Albugo candida]